MGPAKIKPTIAVPITAQLTGKALKDIEEAENCADIAELRLDCMKNPNLELLLHHSRIPMIATNRAKSEGGSYNGTDKKRIDLLYQAADFGASYIDIELAYFHLLDRSSIKPSTRLIVSYHDFERTPENLEDIYSRITETGADIVKIATKANSRRDSLRMLALIDEKSPEKEIIGICMGDTGIITRILGPAYGGYLTFASLDNGKESAPGQITVAELRHAWEVLGIK